MVLLMPNLDYVFSRGGQMGSKNGIIWAVPQLGGLSRLVVPLLKPRITLILTRQALIILSTLIKSFRDMLERELSSKMESEANIFLL